MIIDENYIEKLVNAVAKTILEAFEGLTIKDIEMYRLGYNKAIDDFIEKIQWEYLDGCGIKQSEIEFLVVVSSRIAEQLKEGVNNENNDD